MVDWYLIKPQPTINSEFEYDEFADYAQGGFDELLTETQLGKDIIFCKGRFNGETFETEVEGKGIVQSETPDAYTQGYKRQLLTRIGEISDYKYIKYDGQIWIIMTEPSDNCIYDKCVLHLCNYVFKWQNKNREIIYCPTSIENSSQYNAGESGDRVIYLGSNQFMSYVSIDDDTLAIDRTLRMFVDNNKVNPLVYKVTRHDSVAHSYARNRVLSLVLTEDQYNADTDSIENWLCDYKEVTLPQDIAIIYSGNPTIRVGGTKTLKVETDSQVEWFIEGNLGITLTPNSNSVTVRCPNDYSLVDKSFVVKATVDGAVGSLELTITGGV